MSSVTEAAASTLAAKVIDIETLLVPIPGANPAGEDLRYTLHAEIKEARRADENLPPGDWGRELKVANWSVVVGKTTDALTNKTKDLQICAWLCEALVKLNGFTGLGDGLKVMRGLHERFWDHVYPQPDEGDLEERANSLAWMNGKLALAVKELPLTKSITGDDYTFLQWENSQQLNIPDDLKPSERKELNLLNELKASAREDWQKAKSATRPDFYEETAELLNVCWAEFEALDQVMDEKFDRQTPGLGKLKKALEEIGDLIERIVKEKRALEPNAGSHPTTAIAAPVGRTQSLPVANETTSIITHGQIGSRQEALKQLAEIAEFFHRTEPHSPVSYLVQRAVRWGQMPLEMWLEDVIKDGSVLGQLRETLGLSATSGDGNNS